MSRVQALLLFSQVSGYEFGCYGQRTVLWTQEKYILLTRDEYYPYYQTKRKNHWKDLRSSYQVNNRNSGCLDCYWLRR